MAEPMNHLLYTCESIPSFNTTTTGLYQQAYLLSTTYYILPIIRPQGKPDTKLIPTYLPTFYCYSTTTITFCLVLFPVSCTALHDTTRHYSILHRTARHYSCLTRLDLTSFLPPLVCQVGVPHIERPAKFHTYTQQAPPPAAIQVINAPHSSPGLTLSDHTVNCQQPLQHLYL
jgi:hypothetical protein